MTSLTDLPKDIIEAAEIASRQTRGTSTTHQDALIIALAILAERQRDQWQEIATAPKDGTEILSFSNQGIVIIHWIRESYFKFGEEARWFPIRNPTRWMPLPSPPF